ncbi:hypothetical protein [Limoniibacter endophyticus]|uniref:Uncharacterized protein n=1 Tax=Limoniibacter endophyticus TaxID=1565040 RepID=A0A8J3DN71_9HYPH|nr:hypothetical protein [Limoniibacter endophyticus]GHC65708.1 hypothetical protein GCM10010136_08620 [Limoniibacter endophyticus]
MENNEIENPEIQPVTDDAPIDQGLNDLWLNLFGAAEAGGAWPEPL